MSRKYESKSFKPCRCCCKWRCQCLVPRRRKPHPPFNSGTEPDSKLGLHPKLQILTISPTVGFYYPRSIDRERGIISWKQKQEAEEFSATMGGKLSKEIMFQRILVKTGRGPGTYEIARWPDTVLQAACKGLRRDVDFGTIPRFEPSYKSTTPGPGYTLKVHNPYYYLDEKRFRGFSQVPPFEFDGLVSRLQRTSKSWSLPCNRYNVKHPDSLQASLEKLTSKRGPYDLFTGPRDETTIKGYWARPKTEYRGDWPRKFPGETEKLFNRCNYFKGKWSSKPRFIRKPVTRMMLQDISTCYKDPDEPGPGHYDPRSPRKPTTLKRYPFESNVEHARPFPPHDIRPGPNKYRIKQDVSVKGRGWTCVFKSRVPRTIAFVTPPSYSDF